MRDERVIKVREVRLATADDENALWEMLTYAASMKEDSLEEAIRKARADLDLSKYVDGFGSRNGDLGVIAVEDDSLIVVGAAWVRLGTDPPTPHTVATLDEPELAIGVVPAARAGGIGSRLMTELLSRAQSLYPAVRLSVRTANPSVRLYERHGFERIDTVVNRVGGDSIVMRRQSGKTLVSQS
jgi:ribosomal protein S18 acetylase RimI-like enzyme